MKFALLYNLVAVAPAPTDDAYTSAIKRFNDALFKHAETYSNPPSSGSPAAEREWKQKYVRSLTEWGMGQIDHIYRSELKAPKASISVTSANYRTARGYISEILAKNTDLMDLVYVPALE